MLCLVEYMDHDIHCRIRFNCRTIIWNHENTCDRVDSRVEGKTNGVAPG